METAQAGLALRSEPQDFPAIALSERDRILTEFNRTAVAYPQDRLIHEVFEAQVVAAPEAVAIQCGDQRLTYWQLNEKANRIAHVLIARGVLPDTLVGIFAERGVAVLVGILGILKAGGAYVPLDPNYPQDRLAFMLADARPTVVLAQADLMDMAAQFGVPTLELGEQSSQPTSNPSVAGLTARHLAYVMYTSGSTGQPKGVMIEHRGVLRLIINANYADIRSHDCVTHCSSPSFDASTWEVWAALLNGARLLVVPQRVLLNPHELNRLLVSERVTAMFLTVGLFNEYVDALEEAFGGLEYLITGGDVLDVGRVAQVLSKQSPPRHLISAYGPTEATAYASTFPIAAVARRISPIPIGRPICNTSIYILGANGELAPIAITGEIFIGGPGLARGYLNQPALTAARFIADAFNAGERLYRTGDLGRWLADGNIEFAGRNDSQVKIRGFRVELGEVEAALRRLPGVNQSIVIARDDMGGPKQLVAYVVPESRVASTRDGGFKRRFVKEVRTGLRERLPSFMMPSAIVVLPTLPLTAHGKVDRRALPLPVADDLASDDYVAPRSGMEEELAVLWAEILNSGPVSRNGNFIELGGNSIAAMKLVVGVEKRFAVSLQAHAVLESCSLADLAQIIDESMQQNQGRQPSELPSEMTDLHTGKSDLIQQLEKAQSIEDVPRLPWPGDQAIALTATQQMPWHFTSKPRSRARTEPFAYRISGPLDIGILSRCLEALTHRHDALRTRITVRDGVLRQRVEPLSEHRLEVIDLSSRDEASAIEIARGCCDEFIGYKIDYAVDALFDTRLIKVTQTDHILLVSLDHIITDGVSNEILKADIWALYRCLASGRAVDLPMPSLQFSTHASWLERVYAGWLRTSGVYWSRRLSSVQGTHWPPGMTQWVAEQGSREQVSFVLHRVVISSEVAVTIQRFAQCNRVLPALVMLTAYVATVLRWCDQSELTLAVVDHGRYRADLMSLVGCLANHLHLRVGAPGNQTLEDLLGVVNREFSAAARNRDFDQVTSVVPGLHTDLYFNWFPPRSNVAQEIRAADGRGPAITVEPMSLTLDSETLADVRKALPFKLMLACSDEQQGIAADLWYTTDLFNAESMQRFAKSFYLMLRAVLELPTTHVRSISIEP